MASKLDKKLARLDAYFQSAIDHPSWMAWRENARKCYEYRDGNQWTQAELRELQKRNQPPTVNNQVKVTIDRMVGRFVQSKTRVAYRGRNPEDAGAATVMDEIYRYIAQNNRFEFEERDVFEDGATGGFGCIYASASFDDLLQPEINLRAVDPFEIYPDPWSRRYNWNEDANFICWAKWLHFDEAEQLYPKYARRLAGIANSSYDLLETDAFRGDDYIDFDERGKPRRIRLVECWYKEKTRVKLLITTDDQGQEMIVDSSSLEPAMIKQLMAEGAREIVRIVPTMRVAVFSAGILFDDRESPHATEMFPFVPFFVHRQKDGEPYSPIRVALPLQEAINKRESKALHLLNSNQAIFQQGAIRDKAELAEELAKPDGLMEVRRMGELSIEKNHDIALSQFQMHQQSQNDFRRVTGVNTEALGEPSEIRSGVGIARKQQMADMILSPAFDNFRRTRAILAKLIVEFVGTYYTEPKALLVLDELGQQAQFLLGEDALAAIKVGQYDVVVEEVPDLTTLQQEQTSMLMQNLPGFLQFGPGWATVLIEMSEIKGKDAILQRVQQLTPPQPPEPNYSLNITWDQLTPEEKIAFAGQLNLPALAEAQEEDAQPTTNQSRQETELSREMIRAGAMGAQTEIASRQQASAMNRRSQQEETIRGDQDA